jgi:hypothetical protein
MLFYVRMTSGVQFGPFDMDGETTTFLDIKRIIHGRSRLPIDEQRLFYNQKQLENQRTLNDYNIPENAVLNLVSRLSGG